MAFLHSCCFWRSLRTGSYASAIYTLIYFGISCIIVSLYLHDEREYLSGEVERPSGESFLEKEKISSTTVIFNIFILICASCGVISSILVIIGLKTDQRELLLPWILNMIADILVEVAHFVYLIILRTMDFEPLTAILFTIDFFIMCLNVYCFLCVISQYQEYKVGRGGARHQLVAHAGNVRYIPPSPTHIYVNNIRQNRALISPIICPHTNCTLIPEENLNENGSTCEMSESPEQITKISPLNRKNSNSNGSAKKHVQFPDEIKLCSEKTILAMAVQETQTMSPASQHHAKLYANSK